MKRMRGIMLLLAVSAILNVLVAWGIAVTVNFEYVNTEGWMYQIRDSSERTESDEDTQYIFNLITKHRFGSLKITSTRGIGDVRFFEELYEFKMPVYEISPIPYWSHESVKTGTDGTFWSIGRGWPLIAMVSDQIREPTWVSITTFTTSGPEKLISAEFGLVLHQFPWSSGRSRVLPLRPAWRGFAANTAFYAVLLWLPLIARRVIRRRRGYCPACGYDLRKDLAAGCPECGWRRREEVRAVDTTGH